MQKFPNADDEKHVALMQCKESGCIQATIVADFSCIHDVVFLELRTQQIRKVLRPSMAASAYTSKYGCTKEVVAFLFCYRLAAVTLVSDGRIPQLSLVSNRRKNESVFVNLTTSTIFKVMIFCQYLSVSSTNVLEKMLTVPEQY